MTPGSELSTAQTRVGGTAGPIAPGVVLAVGAAALAALLHLALPDVGTLTWAVLLGVVVTNCGLLPRASGPGIAFAVRPMLRVGIVLLGLSLSLGTVAALGLPVLSLVLGTVVATLLSGVALGRFLGINAPRRLVVAVGCAICGASAIAAVEGPADADEDDVAVAIAVVTVFGSVAMLALPLLQGPLGLDDRQLGIWAGASVHEVGQVVATATPAGAAAVAIATVVKLCRVLCLAPVLAGVSLWRRSSLRTRPGARAPLIPMFVVGFFGCVVLRTTGLLPDGALTTAATIQSWLLAAALFGLGTGVRVRSLLRGSGPVLVLGAGTSLVASMVALAGVLMLG